MNFVPSKTPANSGFSKFQIEYFYVFSPAFLSKIFLNDFWAVKIGLKYTRRVVREVEGAALEISAGSVNFVPLKTPANSGFSKLKIE